MKKSQVILMVAIMIPAILFQSCKKEDEVELPQNNESILPDQFMVDIPSSISSEATFKNANFDTLQGNDIYEHLRTFIHVGEDAAQLTTEIILSISWFNLSQPMSFTFTGDDDGRLKQVVIIENGTYEGVTYAYKLTLADIDENDSELSTNTAMQIFWDKNPVKGVALLRPWNIDRTTNPIFMQTKYRIDYSEAGEMGYDRHMLVTIDKLPVSSFEPFAVSTLKMFVGKDGDVVDIYGNTEHPNANFFNGDTGFDWAFVASGSDSQNIAVAEVGLPPLNLDSDDRYKLLVEHSIQNVFEAQIYDAWPWIDSTIVQSYLYNTAAPGFFTQGGFVQGGTAPSQDYAPFMNIIQGLKPFNPVEINELEILFD